MGVERRGGGGEFAFGGVVVGVGVGVGNHRLRKGCSAWP